MKTPAEKASMPNDGKTLTIAVTGNRDTSSPRNASDLSRKAIAQSPSLKSLDDFSRMVGIDAAVLSASMNQQRGVKADFSTWFFCQIHQTYELRNRQTVRLDTRKTSGLKRIFKDANVEP
ncbi:hypothetical protein NBRC116589_11820 [Ruegeria sp. HU-ET01832]|uniref:hypothetical protein n=1 Tax=Ruegeria sp. HU-ET01832 TaxID=3135906 RepID=UPI003103BDC1